MSQKREGYEVSSRMLDVWSVQMTLAKKLIEVCKKHNLRLWAVGGTLLGAVRHKGYIPWDDDIDMGMPRKDYDKLVSLAKSEFIDPFFLQNGYSDRDYPRGHGQFRMRGTSAILPDDIFKKFDQSIFIDIFIYDDVPNSDEDLKLLLQKASLLRSLLEMKSIHRILLTRNLAYYCRILRTAIYFFFHRFDRVFGRYEDLFRAQQADAATRFGWIAYVYREQFIWDKEWFRDTVWLPFEDFNMPAPIDYDKVLLRQYGPSYMKPVMAPSDHGGYAALDASRSYTEILPMLRAQVRKNRLEYLLARIGFKKK